MSRNKAFCLTFFSRKKRNFSFLFFATRNLLSSSGNFPFGSSLKLNTRRRRRGHERSQLVIFAPKHGPHSSSPRFPSLSPLVVPRTQVLNGALHSCPLFCMSSQLRAPAQSTTRDQVTYNAHVNTCAFLFNGVFGTVTWHDGGLTKAKARCMKTTRISWLEPIIRFFSLFSLSESVLLPSSLCTISAEAGHFETKTYPPSESLRSLVCICKQKQA